MAAIRGSIAAVIGKKAMRTALPGSRPEALLERLVAQGCVWKIPARRSSCASVISQSRQRSSNFVRMSCWSLAPCGGVSQVTAASSSNRNIGVRDHPADFPEDIAEHRPHHGAGVEDFRSSKVCTGMLPDLDVAVGEVGYSPPSAELVEGLPNTELQDGQGLGIHVGMADPLGVNPATTGTHLDMAPSSIGHEHQEGVSGSAHRRAGPPGFVNPAEKRMRPGTQRNAELGHEIEEPLQEQFLAQRIIDRAQGLQAQARIAQVIPVAPEQIGE